MGATVPAAGSIRVAPQVRVTSICSTDVSKPREASCRTRSDGEIWYSRDSSWLTQAREPWLTATALGWPVEPDV